MTSAAHRTSVSVIIATYNGAETLPYTLRSVLNQSFDDIEIFVIGDGCTDGSEAIVKGFGDSRLHWHNLPTNSGSQPAPNNEGLRRATGDYIAYCGHDDLWFPDHLAVMVAFMQARKLDFSYAYTASVKPSGTVWARGHLPITKTHTQHPPPSSWLHRSSLVKRAGPWPENYLQLFRNPDVTYFQDLFNTADPAVQPCPTLSVIKLGSSAYQSYRDKTDVVRDIEHYCDSIADDPAACRMALYQAIAEAFVDNYPTRSLPLRYAIGKGLEHIRYSLFDRLESHPIFWPMLNRRYLRRRKRQTRRRGLSAG